MDNVWLPVSESVEWLCSDFFVKPRNVRPSLHINYVSKTFQVLWENHVVFLSCISCGQERRVVWLVGIQIISGHAS